jgi:UDPglucose 6-dehydrogenase|tara:strand:- start:18847 stop:19632 length:786 start_codon:yes stop_codon:yes gene_type:complete
VKLGLVGRGFVGDALYKSFQAKGHSVLSYDKHKQIGSFSSVESCDVIFLCLPTPFREGTGFDKSAINETCHKLSLRNFSGLVVLKSTIEPGTCKEISDAYKLDVAHNPEFLTARSNYEDFHNQKHIVLGKVKDSQLFNELSVLYMDMYPDAKVSICSSYESECMKIFCNSFYAAKVQFFNELYLLCNKIGVEYSNVRRLMLSNNWINPMHTLVPGPDGQLSYGGACFPKDTKALERFMQDNKISHEILSAVIKEREAYRDD